MAHTRRQGMPSPRTDQSSALMPGNKLLDLLPGDVRARLFLDLHEVELKAGEVLYASRVRQPRLYFPCEGIISVFHAMGDASGGAVAMVGNEGVVGSALLLQSETASTHAVVLVHGHALCLESDAFRREFRRGNAFQQVLLRYIQSRIAEMAQVAVCNRHHSIEQQLCRWLLLHAARAGSNQIHVTHEAIAGMLGVRREGVSLSARKLQQAGLIRYRHSHIQVLDAAGLERRSCACYRAIVNEHACTVALSLVV